MAIEIDDPVKFCLSLSDFIDDYGDKYDPYLLDLIETKLIGSLSSDYRYCEFDQVLIELGYLPDINNRYLSLYNIIKERFDLGRNVVEIGGGPLPIMGKLVSAHQRKLQKGTLTIYDPALVYDELSGVKLVRERVCGDKKLGSDLIIAVSPCDGTMDVIEQAKKDDCELFLAMCSCIHDSDFNSFSEWHDYVRCRFRDSIDDSRFVYQEEFDGNPILIKKAK